MIPGAVDVLAARRRIRGVVDVTPLHRSAWLSDAAGTAVWLKLECVQLTGSFKIRGALNALMRLGREPAKEQIRAALHHPLVVELAGGRSLPHCLPLRFNRLLSFLLKLRHN